MLTRRIFSRSKHIHGRVMTNPILEEETILASVFSLFHVPTILFRPGYKTPPYASPRCASRSLFCCHPPYPCAGDT